MSFVLNLKARHLTFAVSLLPRCCWSEMLGFNTLLHISSAIALAMLYKQYQDIRLLLETRDDMAAALSRSFSSHKTSTFITEITHNGSSVACLGSDHTARQCHFRDLCYLPQEEEFVFFHSPNSITEGVPRDRFNPALADFSSISNHNAQYFNYADLPASKATEVLQDAIFITSTALLFRRNIPSNIMHVFHDDLLPMYHTLRSFTLDHQDLHGRFDVQLAFMDEAEEGSLWPLYQLFSTHVPITKAEMINVGRPVCFRDAHVGLSKSTVWYQYGFFQPQGPISPNITSLELSAFVAYLKHELGVPRGHDLQGTAVILSRQHNRLILNELELSQALARRLGLKVLSLSLENHSVAEIVQALSGASLLVGMHGSLLVLSMFLPPGALLVELFPYAINPEHYTPYKTLAGLASLHYHSWRNFDLERTVTHPDRPRELGGIAHLSAEAQARIIASQEVPLHLCCSDPEWLFRIYQDTHVDVEAVVQIAAEYQAIPAEINPQSMLSEKILPSHVMDMSCEAELLSLTLAFSEPWNLQYLDFESVQYEVWIQDQSSGITSAYILNRTMHTFSSGLSPQTEYRIWIRCIVDQTRYGPFNLDPLKCSTES